MSFVDFCHLYFCKAAFVLGEAAGVIVYSGQRDRQIDQRRTGAIWNPECRLILCSCSPVGTICPQSETPA